MKKRMVYILVGFLFLAGCPQANADSASPKAVQRNGKEEFLLQEKGDKKEQRICRSIQVHQAKRPRAAFPNSTFSVYRCRFV